MLRVEIDGCNLTKITIKGIEFGIGVTGYELRQDATEKPELELQVNKSRVDTVIKSLMETKLEYTVENWITEPYARITIKF